MTATTKAAELPEAIRLAQEFEQDGWIAGTKQWCEEVSAELRRLHAQVSALSAAQAGVPPWSTHDLHAMVEALQRVIDAHHDKANPFHNPINAQASIAIRYLRGYLPYMEAINTAAPVQQAAKPSPSPAPADLITIRKPTTRAEVEWLAKLAHLLIGDVNATLDGLLASSPAPAQPGQEGELLQLALAYKEYIDALPADVVATLPAMPGVDGDWASEVLDRAARAAPQPATADAVDALPDEKTCVDYVLQYGGRCRDCADENGVCPGSGLPCGGQRKAVTHVVQALRYGLQHGYLRTAQRRGA